MQELLADRKILIEALSEVVMLATLLKVVGLDNSGVREDAGRLARRLAAINRKIEEYGD